MKASIFNILISGFLLFIANPLFGEDEVLSPMEYWPILVFIAVLFIIALPIRLFCVPFFSRFDPAFRTAVYFLNTSREFYSIVGNIVEYKELPMPNNGVEKFRQYDFSITGQYVSGILNCKLETPELSFNTKWHVVSATFTPADSEEEIELKIKG